MTALLRNVVTAAAVVRSPTAVASVPATNTDDIFNDNLAPFKPTLPCFFLPRETVLGVPTSGNEIKSSPDIPVVVVVAAACSVAGRVGNNIWPPLLSSRCPAASSGT